MLSYLSFSFTNITYQEEFICELEGIRVITEVIVHLCSHQNKNSSEMSGVKGTCYKSLLTPFFKSDFSISSLWSVVLKLY